MIIYGGGEEYKVPAAYSFELIHPKAIAAVGRVGNSLRKLTPENKKFLEKLGLKVK